MSINPDLKRTTLVLIREGNKILLGLKKRGFGAGRWNGFGGKVKGEETFEQAAERELVEESGIATSTLKPCGVLRFGFDGDPTKIECRVFTAEKFMGEPRETEEMSPRWFDIDKIPFDQMWPDDIFWFPMFLDGKNFEASFTFAPDQKTILEKEVVER